MSKKALLIISFGTSYKDSALAIENVENYLTARYEGYDFYRAYTSRFIVEKLKKRDNLHIHLPLEALEQLKQEGYDEVVCQSLHIINGVEYEMTKKEVLSYKDHFKSLRFTAPLLNTLEDYEKCVEAIMDEVGTLDAEHALVLMGHGTVHHSNAAYSQLEMMFNYKGYANVFVGTVEGFPEIEYVVDKVKKVAVKQVTLMPFMIVAGDHAKNDMASDEEDSWKSVLEAEGIEVTTKLVGIGELDKICEIFYEHLEESVAI